MIVRNESYVPPAEPEVIDQDPLETAEWLDSLEAVLRVEGPERARFLIETLIARATAPACACRWRLPPLISIRSVSKTNRLIPATGNSNAASRASSAGTRWRWSSEPTRTPTSAATSRLTLRRRRSTKSASTIFFTDAPSIKTATLSTSRDMPVPVCMLGPSLKAGFPMSNFSIFGKSFSAGGGLSSYPHPWLMPNFWQFPTVSMGLGPIMSIYQARYNYYLHDRDLADTEGVRVWAFLGDGETDEPETLGCHFTGRPRETRQSYLGNQLQFATARWSRPRQRQDHSGLGRQSSAGAGWNVIKVIWGSGWDPLLKADKTGGVGPAHGRGRRRRVSELRSSRAGPIIREHFFNTPELQRMVEHFSDAGSRTVAARWPRPARKFMPPTKKRSSTAASRA